MITNQIQQNDDFVSAISHLVPQTENFAFKYDLSFLRAFEEPQLLTSCDGVGSKIDIARMLDDYTTIGIDLVAMNTNDILVHGGVPYFFLDYYATGVLNQKRGMDIINGIVKGCDLAECSLVGGETAILPMTYMADTCDIAGMVIGFTSKKDLLPKIINKGDWLIGLKSSGIHSNGYTLIHKLIREKRLKLTENLLTPTQIYANLYDDLIGKVNGLIHITGGGFNNINRICKNYDLFNWKFTELFSEIQTVGNFTREEMLQTFNCGYGLVAIVDNPDDIEVEFDVIGRVK
jgi:phosphoribosylformylglycinamidine cyclo-ligase